MDDDAIENIELRPASLRRNFTIRNNVARQVAVNFMPSRQAPYNTLRLRRVNSENNALLDAVSDEPDAEKQANIIVREMEQHNHLMEDNPVSEELRREALRDLPQALTMKRTVRAKLSASVSLRSKRRPISMFKRLKYRISFAWKKMRESFRDLIFSIELWYEPIRHIEGQLGSAVGSYFHLLRWLFAMDLMLSVFVISLVVVPQVLHDGARNETSTEHSWGFLDFISGTGVLEDSPLFYGHYHPGDISTSVPLTYNMPFAYFFTMLCLYVMFFAVLCYRTAASYRRHFIEAGGAQGWAARLFCAWDCGVVTPRAAARLAAGLYLDFKELLAEQNKVRKTISLYTKIFQRIVNTTVWCMVVAGVVGLQMGLWRLLELQPQLEHWQLLVSLLVTVGLAIIPLVFHFIVRLEHYGARTSTYVTLCRTWLLDVSTLAVLFVYWARSNTPCWETSLGQAAYQLVMLDAPISLLVLPAVEFARMLLFKLKLTASGPEFNVAYNSLSVIYNQAVLWMALLLSPLLVVAVTIKFLLLFYVKQLCALNACLPARKVWRAAQTQTALYLLVTLSLFITVFGIGVLFLGSSSQSCGPFQQYERVVSVVGEGLLGLSQRPALHRLLVFITRPGVIGFVFVALCVCVYLSRARSQAQQSTVRLLRHMLLLQAKDKDFLLNAITKVADGEWLYSPKAEESADSHTWKYLHEVRKPSNAGFHFDASRLSHFERPRERPLSERPKSDRPRSDGDTDSSFSWQGSSNYLNDLEAKRMI